MVPRRECGRRRAQLRRAASPTHAKANSFLSLTDEAWKIRWPRREWPRHSIEALPQLSGGGDPGNYDANALLEP